MSDNERDDNIQYARMAEAAEQYEKMRDCMKEVVLDKKRLSIEERNLLSVAYKNVVGARRASWRILVSIEQTEDANTEVVEAYRKTVERELEDICRDILDLLSNTLTKGDRDTDESAKVFYHKMMGDYYRYLAEFQTGSAREDSKDSAASAYGEALAISKTLPATNPIGLGLALNFSVFHYEILENPKKACQIAKERFDQAVGELDDLPEDEYKDATLIMQLLRDNLTLWQQEERNKGDYGDNVEQDIEVNALSEDEFDTVYADGMAYNDSGY